LPKLQQSLDPDDHDGSQKSGQQHHVKSDNAKRIANQAAKQRPPKCFQINGINDFRSKGEQCGGESPDKGSVPTLGFDLVSENSWKARGNDKNRYGANQVFIFQSRDRTTFTRNCFRNMDVIGVYNRDCEATSRIPLPISISIFLKPPFQSNEPMNVV
jgi:hypothetical protein